MPYIVLQDAVTVPKALSEIKNSAGSIIGYEHASFTYLKGVVLEDDDVSPTVQKLHEDGDPHVTSVLQKLTEAQAKKRREASPDAEEEEEET